MKKIEALIRAFKTAGYILFAILFLVFGLWIVATEEVMEFYDWISVFFLMGMMYRACIGIYTLNRKNHEEIREFLGAKKATILIVLSFTLSVNNLNAQNKKPVGMEHIKVIDASRIGFTSPGFIDDVPKKLILKTTTNTIELKRFGPMTKDIHKIYQSGIKLPKGVEDTSSSKKPWVTFKQEPGGIVCVNGLEKLEFAWATDRSLLFVIQLHFHATGKLEGRIFTQVKKENYYNTSIFEKRKKEDVSMIFFNSAFDLTYKETPLHGGLDVGYDQLHQMVSYGSGFDFYWSDIPEFKVFGKSIDIPKTFHILRTGVSYMSFVKKTHKENSFEDSNEVKKAWETSLLFQMQPLHITNRLSIFSEGSFQIVNKDDNFFELELGLKYDEKIFENLMGAGVRLSWEDSHFHSLSGVIRFNISNPNPKHLDKEVKKRKKRKTIASTFRGRCFFICKIIELGA